jgi:hypothetical protein
VVENEPVGTGIERCSRRPIQLIRRDLFGSAPTGVDTVGIERRNLQGAEQWSVRHGVSRVSDDWL